MPHLDTHEEELTERIEERFRFHDPLRRAQERLEAIERGEPDPALTVPAPPVAPPPGGRGILADVPLQVVGGVRDAVVEAGQAVESLGNLLREKTFVGDVEKALGLGRVQVEIPEVAGSVTVTGGLTRGAAQFLTGFLPGLKVAKGLGITGSLVRGMAAGALADLTVFDPSQHRVSNLLKELAPALRNPITDFLAASPDDTQAEGRLKNALEGLVLGGVFDGIFQAAKLMRSAKRAGGAGVRAAEAVEGIPRPEPVRAPGVKPVKLPEADDVTAISKRFESAVERQRRGTRPVQQAIDEAQEAFPQGKMTPEYLRTLYPGATLNDTEAVALIEVVSESAGKLQTLGRGFLSGDTTWETFMDQLSTFAHIEPLRLGVEAEAGRTLRILGDPIVGKRKFIEQATKALQKAEGGLTREQVAKQFAEMKSLQELTQVARNLTKPGWWDLFVEVRVNGLLSGPRTFAANAFGNTTALGETIFERFAAEKFGTGLVAPGETSAMLTGVVQSWGDAMRLAAKSFRGEVPEMLGEAVKLEGRLGRREQVFARVIREKLGDFGSWLDTVETLINAPGRALMAADDFFKAIGFSAELRALARREAYQTARAEGLEGLGLTARVAELEQALLTNPPAHLKAAATDFAQYVTFTRGLEGKTAEAISAFSQTPVGQFVVPFTRTPQNIFKFTLERTPAAPLLPSVRRALQAGGVERELALARIYTGSMMMAFTGVLAYDGIITGGGPTDPDLKRTLRLTGWQPYSVKIGNQWVSYGRLEPLGSILGMAADFVEIAGEL
ncbi:MAG: hypothetical protein ACT4PO_06815, partial [Actinomycetota bacterium]